MGRFKKFLHLGLLMVATSFGLLGFIDDYLKIKIIIQEGILQE